MSQVELKGEAMLNAHQATLDEQAARGRFGGDTRPRSPRVPPAPAADAVSVSTAGLSDSPADQDQIGFAPYVRAVYRLITSDETRAPLTMSIEGRWGSGKSSFMLQLAARLRASDGAAPAAPGAGTRESAPPQPSETPRMLFSQHPRAEDARYTVWFNAWRFDKDESLWASFALVLIEQLKEQVPAWQRVKANLQLTLRRFDVDRAAWTLLQLAAFVLALIVLCVLALEDPKVVAGRLMPTALDAKTLGTGGGAVALVAWAWSRARRFLGNPLERDLKKFVRDPGYRDRLPFAERFQDDLARILKSYVGRGRVYVFIDDLDRAEVPRAADLMQAINLLVSADQQLQTKPGERERGPANLFFILGIDRQVIAAGLAAKSEKLIPYIANARSTVIPEAATLARLGVDYGYEFLEKFIQVSFRIPQMDTTRVGHWVSSLTGEEPLPPAPPPPVADGDGKAGDKAAAAPSISADIDRISRTHSFSAGADPEGFGAVVSHVTVRLGFNPRKIRQFINVLRLQVLVLIETGRLVPAAAADGAAGLPEGLTLEKIAVASAILMRWPVLVRDLGIEPDLLSRLTLPAEGCDSHEESKAVEYWRGNAALADALQMGGAYSLLHADLRPLLELVSDAAGSRAAWVEAGGRLGRLIPQSEGSEGAASRPSPESPPPTSASA